MNCFTSEQQSKVTAILIVTLITLQKSTDVSKSTRLKDRSRSFHLNVPVLIISLVLA
jgi:hypothetical protein